MRTQGRFLDQYPLAIKIACLIAERRQINQDSCFALSSFSPSLLCAPPHRLYEWWTGTTTNKISPDGYGSQMSICSHRTYHSNE
eukprot:scaffold15691_cov21-Tisochrysis_lutea.AAC.2